MSCLHVDFRFWKVMSASPHSLLEYCYSPRVSMEGLWVFRCLSLISSWASIFFPQNYNPKKSSAVFFSHFLFLSFYNLEISHVSLRKLAESQAQFSVLPSHQSLGPHILAVLAVPDLIFISWTLKFMKHWLTFLSFILDLSLSKYVTEVEDFSSVGFSAVGYSSFKSWVPQSSLTFLVILGKGINLLSITMS